MTGQHARSESLFYYFRIEDQVPEDHLLRLLDRHISFDFVREKLKDSYSDIGRPSIALRAPSVAPEAGSLSLLIPTPCDFSLIFITIRCPKKS